VNSRVSIFILMAYQDGEARFTLEFLFPFGAQFGEKGSSK